MLHLSKPGLICCAGNSAAELWDNICNYSKSFFSYVPFTSERSLYAGIIDDSSLPDSKEEYKSHLTKIHSWAIGQIEAEIEEAVSLYGKERIGVFIGTCDNGSEFSEVSYKKGEFGTGYQNHTQYPSYIPELIKARYGFGGSAVTINTACSSSAQVFIRASQMINAGIIDAAIVGGIDLTSSNVALGFDSLKSVSSEPTNPMSANRHGLTLGEAAVYFVLSKDKLNCSEIDYVLKGYGECSDAYHMTSPDPEGKGAAQAMTLALAKAGLKPADIDYVNLHGTGTRFNDSMEDIAVDAVYGSYKVPVSSTKSITGHTLGAAGALEAAVCYETILNKTTYPAQVWDGDFDPEIPKLNIIDKNNNKAIKPVKNCMSNSFAFGGSNSSLVFGVEE
ncbi:MAG: 3-oxoacyl-ACP synthase [Treponema sp.]|nr:3-oxoacyl-ACP synthase [Treponema sp.]